MAIDQVASLPFLSPLTLSLFSFPSGKSSLAATVLGHCSLMGAWTSALSAFSLQHCSPRKWVRPSLLDPQPPPSPPSSERFGSYHCTGACIFGIGAFFFWQPSYQSFFCSSVLFKVYCLPKMTSLRCSRWGVSADLNADFKCQVSSVRIIEKPRMLF